MQQTLNEWDHIKDHPQEKHKLYENIRIGVCARFSEEKMRGGE